MIEASIQVHKLTSIPCSFAPCQCLLINHQYNNLQNQAEPRRTSQYSLEKSKASLEQPKTLLKPFFQGLVQGWTNFRNWWATVCKRERNVCHVICSNMHQGQLKMRKNQLVIASKPFSNIFISPPKVSVFPL